MPTIAQTALAKQIAAEVMYDATVGHAPLLVKWRANIDRVWDNDPATIALVLTEFGTNAAEIFASSNLAVAFLESREAGCTADRLAKVRPCTVHQDGTVTLDPA